MRWFPVMLDSSGSNKWPVPWEMVAPHEMQAHENHDQTLERLAERGGLGACELVAVLEDRAWSAMSHATARQRVMEMVMEWARNARK